MPGIVGLQTNMPREWAETQLRRMVQAIQHESFYVSGVWAEESLGVYVGWVARGNSFADCMPVHNERGDVTLVFSGEEFPAPGTIQRLIDRGHRIDRGSASYLVHLYDEDPSFPANLNGRFHGLLVDRARRAVTLFNDRYGMHRLYHHSSKEAVYFSAEAKAILAVRPELRRLDPRALGEYILCGCVLEDRTLFDGIGLVPCGAKWTLGNGAVERRDKYFRPQEWEQQETLEPEKYYQHLRDAFSQQLPRYFSSRERIGLSLTGGLDTRMILAWYQPQPRSLPCYTFGGQFRDCRDVTVARLVAEACQQNHEVVPVGEQFLSRFSRYAERSVYLTDGCADVRRASDLYLNECARAIAPVRMTGNYGSEVLRGVRAFKPSEPTPGLFSAGMRAYFEQAKTTYDSLLGGNPISFAVFKQAPWHHYGLLALEETQVSLRSPYLDNELVRTVFQAPRSTLGSPELCLRLIADGNQALRRIPTDNGVGGTGWSGVVSQRLLEFLKKAEYAYDYGMPQWLAQVDHRLSWGHLERLFLGRHKFNHYRVWYRNALADYIRQMLLDHRTLSRPYLERKMVETMVRGHLQGGRNYTTEIHNVLSLELLHRLLVDAQ